jgi:hypothetical protein
MTVGTGNFLLPFGTTSDLVIPGFRVNLRRRIPAAIVRWSREFGPGLGLTGSTGLYGN